MKETGHTVAITDFRVLDKEEDWHRRGVKEAIWERMKEPSLNKKGGGAPFQPVAHLGPGASTVFSQFPLTVSITQRRIQIK